ncbi:hypothetical protein DYBT9275_03308 [Dyadobacter sp. CECT 9275]|uniref:Endonuclease/exonuclease/phosphatase domain-containing protein n=1 Tax=Dyadobacter helix TaxID=2822344 RepID=A0A916N596_9BACT|nr:endonuclease/exonuclease/phosphatase family protein [Dyadobacter sp. CECT 9275]CAG5004149.1 hypothetical protein DYBT9275_03308 [Dyadobacter sp. CECT 9275]
MKIIKKFRSGCMLLSGMLFSLPMLYGQNQTEKDVVTFATYNVSMEAQNYVKSKDITLSEQILVNELAKGTNEQIRNIASIIQTVRPDVILLNEFDYIQDPKSGILQFIEGYLNQGQNGKQGIDYPYYYYTTVNTGQPSPFDLDNNGKSEKFGSDAWGFGLFPGQYGMVLLSKFPILTDQVRTFQHFKWKDMPGALQTKKADGTDWYSPEAWNQFPLSSKSHWDIPVGIGKKVIHILASHPTPPTFDGAEDRNGKRNHDEIRFWQDYIHPAKSSYIYDDKGKTGGLAEKTRFVILGDQNASPDEGNAISSGIRSLLADSKINAENSPASTGGAQHSANNVFAKNHTAFWRMRADYVLPSRWGFKVRESGVFWPAKGEPMAELVEKREASSDHRMVWVKVALTD